MIPVVPVASECNEKKSLSYLDELASFCQDQGLEVDFDQLKKKVEKTIYDNQRPNNMMNMFSFNQQPKGKINKNNNNNGSSGIYLNLTLQECFNEVDSKLKTKKHKEEETQRTILEIEKFNQNKELYKSLPRIPESVWSFWNKIEIPLIDLVLYEYPTRFRDGSIHAYCPSQGTMYRQSLYGGSGWRLSNPEQSNQLLLRFSS